MLSLPKILGLSTAFFTIAHAHFTLDYPPTRGFDEDLEPQFCGGFPLANNRSLFPLTGGVVEIDSHHETAQFVTLISFSSDPQSFTDFNTTSDGKAIPFLKPFIQIQGTGEACIPVDVASLNVPGVQNGTNATIQVQFNGGDGWLYQCADVTLVSSTNIVPRSCSNTTTITGISTVTAASGATGSSNQPSSTAGTSAPAKTGNSAGRLSSATGLALAAAVFAALL
ncbi:hypothetical protein FRC04_012030 [Tulasnella sp. 424]|nr:hypothetical protein FRC04_012030 [Tulasnella sp. 424]KAG8971270.1 hypothetical protein FRC05_011369 [Tulasnella sp. 425]